MPYKLESELCEKFISVAKEHGWTIFPEQNDWDFIMVRKGIQVGVQAKLKANKKVLTQCLPKLPYNKKGPQYRAVLVGGHKGRSLKARNENGDLFYSLARHLKIIIFDASARNWLMIGYGNNLQKFRGYRYGYKLNLRHYHWHPKKLEWLPDFVPVLPSGVPSPETVSKYKIVMLELRELELERGWICLKDCKQIVKKFDVRWGPSGLLNRHWRCTGKKIPGSKQRKWVLKGDQWDPDILYKNIKDMK
jgi:hypothetical protein